MNARDFRDFVDFIVFHTRCYEKWAYHLYSVLCGLSQYEMLVADGSANVIAEVNAVNGVGQVAAPPWKAQLQPLRWLDGEVLLLAETGRGFKDVDSWKSWFDVDFENGMKTYAASTFGLLLDHLSKPLEPRRKLLFMNADSPCTEMVGSFEDFVRLCPSREEYMLEHCTLEEAREELFSILDVTHARRAFCSKKREVLGEPADPLLTMGREAAVKSFIASFESEFVDVLNGLCKPWIVVTPKATREIFYYLDRGTAEELKYYVLTYFACTANLEKAKEYFKSEHYEKLWRAVDSFKEACKLLSLPMASLMMKSAWIYESLLS